MTITIGNKSYGIPEYYFRKVPRLSNKLSTWDSYITLSDIHEDIGHTIVHFLYSGSYETIISPLDRGVDCIAREYRRSVLVYEAARTYDIFDLEALARRYIEHFGEALSLFDVLRTAKEVFSTLPDDESWLPHYIKQKLEQSFLVDKSIFTDDEFFGILGEDRYFSNAIFKMSLEIYSTRLQLLESRLAHKSSINGYPDMGRAGSESPAMKHDDQEYPEPYDVPNEAPSEGAPADNCPPDEPYPVEYYPEPEEASPEPPSFGDHSPELVPPEPYPEECTPESLAEGSLYPPRPRSVDDYSDKPVPEPCPDEDYAPEPAPPEPYPEECTPEAPAEEPPSPPEENAVRTSTAASLMTNISLYDDWETLSRKEQLKRRKALRKMGLPLPT